MGLRINTNVGAMNAARNLAKSQGAFGRSLSRLSSGFRINQASDDTAGLSIANNLRAQVSGLRVASRNASQASALGQTAEGAATEIGNILNRLRELAVQSASDQNDAAARTALDNERSALESEVDRIANSTEFNGTVLVNGSLGISVNATTLGSALSATNGVADIQASGASAAAIFTVTGATTTSLSLQGASSTQVVTFSAVSGLGIGEFRTLNFSDLGIKVKLSAAYTNGDAVAAATAANKDFGMTATGSSLFQVGANSGANNRITLSGTNLDLRVSGLGITGNVTSQSNANTYIDTIDTAISDLNTALGDLGSFQNRVGFASGNVASAIENTAAAESVIRDADIAEETTNFTRAQILVQAGVSILSQANLSAQSVLPLLR
ncbi:MAG: flagellin [Candidatus Tectomicrobia bacterium]|nr:flagellin [Candidatus Tectomicrobia bacterium]